MFLRSGEKVMYEALARSDEIRFPPTRIENNADKITVLLQVSCRTECRDFYTERFPLKASLAGMPVADMLKKESHQLSINPYTEMMQIFSTGPNV